MKGTIVLSVDDGCNDTARLASELEKRRLPATFNIVTGGTSYTTFSPKDTCTRGHIVTFLYRAFK